MQSENCDPSWPVLPLSLTHKKLKIHILGEFRKCLTLPRDRPCPHCHCLQQSCPAELLAGRVPRGSCLGPERAEHWSTTGRAAILQGAHPGLTRDGFDQVHLPSPLFTIPILEHHLFFSHSQHQQRSWKARVIFGRWYIQALFILTGSLWKWQGWIIKHITKTFHRGCFANEPPTIQIPRHQCFKEELLMLPWFASA